MSSVPVTPDKGARLLLVEDDELQSQILGSILTAAGFTVDTVGSGLAALWKVREGGYDAVLIDYQLPEIDGLAAARLISDFMGSAARPVLIGLTATPERLSARESGTDSAYDAILDKSTDFADLHSVITRCLASAPDSETKQEAEASLLLKGWLDYDAEPARPGEQSDKSGPPRILVVEDDELQQTLLMSVLKQQGYIVDATSNGLEAVLKIRDGGYDLALVDYGLPEIDGLAAGKIIRDLMQEANRPRLIALTAMSGPLNRKQVMASNVFDEILQKSSDLQALIRTVDRHLKSSSNPTTRRAAAFTPTVTA